MAPAPGPLRLLVALAVGTGAGGRCRLAGHETALLGQVATSPRSRSTTIARRTVPSDTPWTWASSCSPASLLPARSRPASISAVR